MNQSDNESGHGLFFWNELLTSDIEKAKAFYAATLGWDYDEMENPDGAYFVALVNDEPVGGLSSMPAYMPDGTPPHWMSYVEVDDLDKSLAGIARAGGKVMRPPFEVPEVGRMAIIADPTGAIMAWITPADHSQD
ncbi:MAG TPA: VOC family protein [Hyphomicrobiaceae bacterium]|nr:VOC family protein [Hyphomicrobiaceae bacterium]